MNEMRKSPCLLYQYALACNLTTCYYMLTMGEGMPGWFFPQILLAAAPAIYLGNRWFLRRERSMLSLLLLNLLLFGALLVGYGLTEPWRGIAYAAFAAMFLAWITVRGSLLARNGPTLRGSLLVLDTAFLMLVAFVGYASATGRERIWCVPAASGLVAAVAATASLRSARPLGGKGWLAIGGAFGGLFGLLGLFLGAAAPAGHGVVAIWKAIVALLSGIKNLIFGGILWLFSLFPDAEPGEMEQIDPQDYLIGLEELPAEEASPILGLVLLGIVVVGGAVALIWLIGRLKSIRLRPAAKTGGTDRPVRQRTPFWQSLLRLARRWSAAMLLRFRLWKNRNTPAGLYFLLVHRCRRAPWHKRTGETAREFLLRLSDAAEEDETLREALRTLARETDVALYSGRTETERLDCAPLIRRRIGRAVRRQLFRSWKTKVCSVGPKFLQNPGQPERK